MTISSETRKAGPTPGNGVATAFPFAFKVFTTADISVTLNTVATGVQTALVLNTDYTVVLNADQNANPGGTVTYNPASGPLPATQTLTIGSVVTRTQGTHLINGGSFLADNVENMVDRAVIGLQQMAEKVDRSIKFPIVDGVLNAELPTAALRASKFMAFDALGQAIASSSVTGAPVEAVIQVVTTVADLKAVAVPTTAVVILVCGYYAAGDGGGGAYRWNSADATADNGGTVIKPTAVAGNGRWNRLYDALQYSVKVFGAKGDNAANDTTYIQATFNALPVGGRAYAPKGTYKTNATLTVNDGTAVQGDGRDVTIISSTVASDILRLSGTNIAQATKKCVFDLSLVGNGATTTSGIAASYLSYAEIARVSIRNCQVGTLTDHANEIKYNQVYADSCTQDGHWVGPVTNNVVYTLCEGVGNVRAGFYQIGGGGVVWTGGALETNGYGALITSALGSRPSGTTIRGAYLEGNTTREVQCQDDGGGAPRGVTLIGNTYTFIAAKAAQAIRLESVDGFKEIGGTFRDDGGQYTNSLFVNNAGTITGDVSFNPAKDTSTGGATAAGNQYFRDETKLRVHAKGTFTVAGGAVTASKTFGVVSITYIAAGVYEITLKAAPNGGTDFPILAFSENNAVASIWCTSHTIPSSPTVFRVQTSSVSGVLADARTVNFTVLS